MVPAGNNPQQNIPQQPSFLLTAARDIVLGGAWGYLEYHVVRLARDFKLMEIKEALNPYNFIALGVAQGAIITAMQGAFLLGKKLLGKPTCAAHILPPSAPLSERVRYQCWRAVRGLEEIVHQIDRVYAFAINILLIATFRETRVRTMRLIRESKIQDIDMTFFEIFRKAFLEECAANLMGEVSRRGGMRILKAFNFKDPLGELKEAWALLGFAQGVALRIQAIRLLQTERDERLEAQEELIRYLQELGEANRQRAAEIELAFLPKPEQAAIPTRREVREAWLHAV